MVWAIHVLLFQLVGFTACGRGLATEAGAPYLVTFTVNGLLNVGSGNFTVKVLPEWAPLGAQRFATLIREKFYVEARFFRVITGFMAQFGMDVSGARWTKRTLRDDKVRVSNTRGRVTFATAGPNSRTTQIFINYANNTRLDREGFAPFGEVVSGMEVVDTLYPGYGDGSPKGHGPAQQLMLKYGNSYLEREFPKMSIVVSAEFTGDVIPPVGPDDNRSFLGLDGLPVIAFMIITTVSSVLIGNCIADHQFPDDARGPRGRVIIHSTVVGCVSMGLWLWAVSNSLASRFDEGVILFMLTFLTSIIARQAAIELTPCVIRWYCRIMPLTCLAVAINYGMAFLTWPEYFTMSLYLGAGVFWWAIAGCSSLPFARSLLKEAETKTADEAPCSIEQEEQAINDGQVEAGHKSRRKSGHKYEDVTVIGADSEL